MTISMVVNQDKVVAHPECILFNDGVSCQSSELIPHLVNDSSIHPYHYRGTILPSVSIPWSASPAFSSLVVSTKELPSHGTIMYKEMSTQKVEFDNAIDDSLGRQNIFRTELVTRVYLENSRS
ncbi:hypothetical protein ACHAW6_008963 [Cyclotella cf. meneghiniana]